MSLKEEEKDINDRREFFKGAISGTLGTAAMVAAVSQLGVPILNAAQGVDGVSRATPAQNVDGVSRATPAPAQQGQAPKQGFVANPGSVPGAGAAAPKAKPTFPPPWPEGTNGTRYAHLWSTRLKENSFMNEVIPGPQAYFRGNSDLPGAKINMGWQIFIQPIRLEMESHHHDHDEYQFYLGATFPDLVGSFDAEIEVFLGPEYERHLITRACVLYLPAGFEHNPCDFRVVNKPVFFTSLDCSPFCSSVFQSMGYRTFVSARKLD